MVLGGSKQPTKIEQNAQTIHNWYTDRHNSYYADAREPGWAHSFDISTLLDELGVNATRTQLRVALNRVASRQKRAC